VFPAQVEVRRAVAAGEWPLLSARIGAGMPLLADPQAQVLQPLVWLPAPLPPADAMAATLALRLFVALAFTWLLLVRLGLAPEAALLGALSYGLGGFVVLWLGWPLANSAALLPLLLYAVTRIAERGGRRDLLLLVAALAAVLAAGHPETMLHVLLAAAAFGVARLFAQPPGRRLRGAALGTAAGLIALALAAPVLVPAARYLPHTQRAEIVAGVRSAVRAQPWLAPFGADVRTTGYSAQRARAAVQVAPNSFGNHRFRHYWGPDNVNADAAGFAGTLAMAGALAALGWGVRRRPGEGVMLALAAVSLAVALRLPGVARLLFSMPLLDRSISLHGRVRLLVSFALAFLAAAALDRWLRGETRGWRWAAAGAAAAALVLWGTLAHPAPPGPPQRLEWLREGSLAVQLAALAVGGAALLAARRAAPAGRRRAALVVALAAAAELLYFHLPAWPPMPRDAAYADTPEMAFLREHQSSPDGHRVMGFDGSILPNTPAVYGLPSPGIGGPMKPAAYAALLAPLLERPGFGGSDRFVVAESPLYDLLGVRYVLFPYDPKPPGGWALRLRGPGGRVYERPGPLPPLWLPGSAAPCHGPWGRCLDGVEDFAAAARVKLEGPLANDAWTWRAAGAPVLDTGYHFRGPAWRRAAVDLAEPRLLASSIHQDGGWTVLMDGEPRPRFTANGPFVAAYLPPGEHQLDLVYRPPGFLAGLLAAALALAALAVVLPPPKRRRPAAATSRSSPSGSRSSRAAR
jgi:hypothetical protein